MGLLRGSRGVIDMDHRWHVRFLELARQVSTWSRDPSTKCGAVLVRSDKSVASLGFNGFPMFMRDDAHLYEDRAVKYDRVIHAEMNAVLFCRDPLPLSDMTLYTTGPCCSRCAVHMLQCGIRRFVWPSKVGDDLRVRWSIDDTILHLKEAGAELIEIELLP